MKEHLSLETRCLKTTMQHKYIESLNFVLIPVLNVKDKENKNV